MAYDDTKTSPNRMAEIVSGSSVTPGEEFLRKRPEGFLTGTPGANVSQPSSEVTGDVAQQIVNLQRFFAEKIATTKVSTAEEAMQSLSPDTNNSALEQPTPLRQAIREMAKAA